MTRVVNLRHQPQFQAYVGRASSCPAGFRGLGADGTYGNPVVPGRVCPVCGGIHAAPGETLPCFTRYLRDRMARDPWFSAQVEALRGLTLACFCAPNPCHADAYVEVLDGSASMGDLVSRLCGVDDP